MHRKKWSKKFIFFYSLLVLGGLFLVGFVIIAINWKTPLGPTLNLMTPTSEPLVQQIADSDPEPDQTHIPSHLTGEMIAEPLCGAPRSLLILAVGTDAGNDSYLYGLADVIRLVHIDFVKPQVVIFSMPRDLWVSLPDIDPNYDVTHGKLNQAYLYGNPGFDYYEGAGYGPGLLASTLAHNFGIYADHYGAISMQAFVDVVDALGGIEIYLDQPVDATSSPEDILPDLGYFPAGLNHMDGETALRFSRNRADSTDARRARQNQIILALYDKLFSLEGVTSLPEISEAFIGRVQTDLSAEQIAMLNCLSNNLERKDIHFGTVPTRLLTEDRVYSEQLQGETYILRADPEEVGQYFWDFIENPE